MGLFGELKRRNVFRVAIAYAVIAWVLAQIAELTFDAFGSPDWVLKTFLAVLALGFPIAVLFAWAFELTPEGIKREKDVDRSASITAQTGRKLDYVIIAVLVVAVGFLLIDRFRLTDVDAPDTAGEISATELEKSIAVLPFDNRSNRDEDQFFTDGIHDDLLTTIANIGSLKVISRTSVMEYRGTTKKIPDIARELGVATILEGGIQRAGNQVRINVQLIDAATDQHLWAEIYDRELTAENLFKIQSEVSNAIARSLHATLSPEEQRRVSSVGTTNLDAYEKYMLGREHWHKRTARSLGQAVELFLDAVELDPDYAAAWAGLSDAYRLQVDYSLAPTEEAHQKAEQAVLRALELDDQLAEAWAALGALRREQLDYETARDAFERAIALNPSYIWTYNWYAILENLSGQTDAAQALFERGLEIDPLNHVMMANLIGSYHATADFDKALARTERLIEIAPHSTLGYEAMADYAISVDGRLDEGVEWLRKALDIDPNDVSARSDLANQYRNLGDHESTAMIIEGMVEQSPDSSYTLFQLYLEALRNGEAALALTLAERLYEIEPQFASFTPAYTTLIERDRAAGQLDKALQREFDLYPELRDPGNSLSNRIAVFVAPRVAYIHKLAGRDEEARQLAELALAETESMPRRGLWGYGAIRVFSYLVLDDNESALAEIRNLLDDRFYAGGWYFFDLWAATTDLGDDPRFQVMQVEWAAEMDRQLANVTAKSSEFEW